MRNGQADLSRGREGPLAPASVYLPDLRGGYVYAFSDEDKYIIFKEIQTNHY
jgi:hypothetical protein